MLKYFPKSFSTKPIQLYIILLGLYNILFFNSSLPVYWMLTGIFEVVAFFLFSHILTKRWVNLPIKVYTQKLFRVALTIRVVYVFFSYYMYLLATGIPFEFDSADAAGYHTEALWLIELFESDQLYVYIAYIQARYSDFGYVAILSFLYSIFDNSIIVVRIFKAILSAATCVFVYKIAKRNFGESTGRMAGVFMLLLPNSIYYCGLHLKETEMVFFTILFIERADAFIKESKTSPFELFLVLLIGLSLFFFRTVLGATAMFSFILAFLVASNKGQGINAYKKAGLIMLLVLLATFFRGGTIEREITEVWNNKGSNQSRSMQARARLSEGNKLAAYGSTIVFAPLILLGPFPTMINIETQQNQMYINGAYYVRNICAFFVILSLFRMYKSRRIRDHMIIVFFLFSYMIVLAFSKFAISERFHMPILFLIIILLSDGVAHLKIKNIKLFNSYLWLVAIIITGWNLFKIMGRGGL